MSTQDDMEAALDSLIATIKKQAEEMSTQVNVIKQAYLASKQLSRFTHVVRFNPPVPKDGNPFRSMTSRVLEKLHTERAMQYHIIEKSGEVMAVEFSPKTDVDKEAVERYAKWVLRVSEEAPPQTG
jgi:hypothetical protein